MKAFTDISQSNKLAEILPLESADMYYDVDSYGVQTTPEVLITSVVRKKDIPCWSLAALMDVLPKGDYKDTNLCYGGLTIIDYVDEWFCSYQQPEPMVMLYTHADNPLDACYEMVLKLHEQNLL